MDRTSHDVVMAAQLGWWAVYEGKDRRDDPVVQKIESMRHSLEVLAAAAARIASPPRRSSPDLADVSEADLRGDPELWGEASPRARRPWRRD